MGNGDYYKSLICFLISNLEDEKLLKEIYYFVEAFVAEEKKDSLIDIERIRQLINDYQKWWAENAKSIVKDPPIFTPTLEGLGWHRTKRFFDLREESNTIE